MVNALENTRDGMAPQQVAGQLLPMASANAQCGGVYLERGVQAVAVQIGDTATIVVRTARRLSQLEGHEPRVVRQEFGALPIRDLKRNGRALVCDA